ncbi:MAG: hypothetical protein P8J32_00240 [bacterium]|nr:hypothetical protein [bacterium]
MDNLRVLRQVYDDYDSERAMYYDKLSRTLNNTDITHDPVSTVKGLVEQIAHLEHAQEVTVGFMNQIQADLAKAALEKEDQEDQELEQDEEQKED